jgi:glycosyltransferase involved in cell wall biosynthesis
MTDLSIIVCTRDRCESLERNLRSIDEMIGPQEVRWEVIIVDNNSKDRTKEVAEIFVKNQSDRYRYVLERRQGKSFALNTGIKAARGQIVAFTDDDCIVSKQWVSSILTEFTTDQDLAVLGGRVELYDSSDRPITIIRYDKRILFQSLDALFDNVLVIGCNMAIRRNVIDELGGFDIALGPGAKSGAVAEETELVYRAHKKGFKVLYSPDVVVYHNHGRQTVKETEHLLQKYFAGRGSFYCKHILKGDIDTMKLAYWDIRSAIEAILANRRAGKPIERQKRFLGSLLKGFRSRIIFMATHGWTQ